MNGRRTVVGLSLLCALVFSAFAAQGASAAGVTAFTCEKGSGAGFTDEHCTKAVGSGATFVHKEIAPGTVTEVVGTNAGTGPETKTGTTSVLHAILGGVEFTIECKTVASTGKQQNVAGPPMTVVGTAINIKYSECTVPKPKNAAGEELCKVKEPIEANATAVATTSEKVTFTGSGAESLFTSFAIESIPGKVCNIGPNLPVKGTVIAKAEGATLNFTGEGTLKIGASAASYTGKGTVRMSGGGNPIALTTTAT